MLSSYIVGKPRRLHLDNHGHNLILSIHRQGKRLVGNSFLPPPFLLVLPNLLVYGYPFPFWSTTVEQVCLPFYHLD
jgi:hypothetical protein